MRIILTGDLAVAVDAGNVTEVRFVVYGIVGQGCEGLAVKSIDGKLIPHGEIPERRSLLQERLENKQVSRLYYLTEPGPTGSYGLVLELTDGAKLIIFAGRDRYSTYAARLLFRWMERPLIVLPRMEKAFAGGRDPAVDPPDDLQQRVEGSVIKGVHHFRTPNEHGGEVMDVEFSGGGRLHLAARPLEKLTAKGPLLADIDYEFTEPTRTRIVMP